MLVGLPLRTVHVALSLLRTLSLNLSSLSPHGMTPGHAGRVMIILTLAGCQIVQGGAGSVALDVTAQEIGAMNTTLLLPVLPNQLHLQIPSHQSTRLPRTHLMIPLDFHGQRK